MQIRAKWDVGKSDFESKKEKESEDPALIDNFFPNIGNYTGLSGICSQKPPVKFSFLTKIP